MNNLEIDERDRMLLRLVAISGDWSSVSRTFSATLSITSAEVYLETKRALLGIVEKIEIISVLQEHPKPTITPRPLSDKIKDILAANPDLFYDRPLFLQLCDELVFPNQTERVDELSDNATMEEVMMLFLTNGSREDFLTCYIERWLLLWLELIVQKKFNRRYLQ